MSYSKHTWENGETITAEKLNNIEQGIASKYYIVENAGTIAWDENEQQWVANGTASVTSLQLLDAVSNQQVPFITMTVIDKGGTTREELAYLAVEIVHNEGAGTAALLGTSIEDDTIPSSFVILEDGTIPMIN